jgi:hypothetical protein
MVVETVVIKKHQHLVLPIEVAAVVGQITMQIQLGWAVQA